MKYGNSGAGNLKGANDEGATEKSMKVGRGYKMTCSYPQDRSGDMPGEGDNTRGGAMKRNDGAFTG